MIYNFWKVGKVYFDFIGGSLSFWCKIFVDWSFCFVKFLNVYMIEMFKSVLNENDIFCKLNF